MRGSIGNFINRLIERFKKIVKKRKVEKEKLIEETNMEKKKKDIKKKKDEEIIVYFVNQKKLNNNKIKLNKKEQKKKIGTNIPKEIKNKEVETKEVIVPIKQEKKEAKVPEKKINIKIEPKNNKKIEIKTINKIPKQKEYKKVENKKVVNNNPKPIDSQNNNDTKNNIIKNNNNKLPYIIKKHKPKKKGTKQINIIKVKSKVKKNIKSENLIKEINKIIRDNKTLLDIIKKELINIEYEIKNTTDVKKINEIERKILEIKIKIKKIIEEFDNIKDGNLDKLAYPKLKSIINNIKKIDSNVNFNNLISLSKLNLDYYNDMINAKINSDILEDKTYYKKELIKNKNNTIEKEKEELNNLKLINSRLSNQINKNKETLKYFNNLIKNIEPEKIVTTQSNFLSNMLRNTANLIGTFISIPFLKRPSNIPLFTFGLFTLNNSIRNMRAVNSKKEIVKYLPSDDYADKILHYKNNFDSVAYLINDSIIQIDFFREEYISNFGNYYDYSEYNKFLNEIDNMKSKLVEQQKNVEILKREYDNTYNKNNAKVLKIKNMR